MCAEELAEAWQSQSTGTGSEIRVLPENMQTLTGFVVLVRDCKGDGMDCLVRTRGSCRASQCIMAFTIRPIYAQLRPFHRCARQRSLPPRPEPGEIRSLLIGCLMHHTGAFAGSISTEASSGGCRGRWHHLYWFCCQRAK